MQNDRDHGGLQHRRAVNCEIDRARRYRFDPVAEPAERAVGRQRRADAGGQRIEDRVPAAPVCTTASTRPAAGAEALWIRALVRLVR